MALDRGSQSPGRHGHRTPAPGRGRQGEAPAQASRMVRTRPGEEGEGSGAPGTGSVRAPSLSPGLPDGLRSVRVLCPSPLSDFSVRVRSTSLPPESSVRVLCPNPLSESSVRDRCPSPLSESSGPWYICGTRNWPWSDCLQTQSSPRHSCLVHQFEEIINSRK